MRKLTHQLVISTLLFFISKNIEAQTQISTKYSVDFYINALVTKGDTLIAGGNFNNAGIYTGGGALFSTSSDKPNLQFPKILGSVYASTPDGKGGYYIYGKFRKVQDTERPFYRIEHVLPNFSFEPGFSLTVDFDGVPGVSSILYHDGLLYIDGYLINSIAGQPVKDLSAVDVATKKIVNWLPAMDSINRGVSSIAIQKNTLYVTGNFATIGGKNRDGIAAIELYTGNIKTWNPAGNWAHGGYNNVAFYKGKVIIGGGFSDSVFDNHACAVVDTVTGRSFHWIFNSFNPEGLQGKRYVSLYWAANVTQLAIKGDILYTYSQGTGDTRITAISLKDSVNLLWTRYFNQIAWSSAMAVIDNSLYVGGGWFDAIYKTDSTNDNDTNIERHIRGLVKLEASTGNLQNWNPAPVGLIYNDVWTLSTFNTALFVGGNFSHVNGLARTGIVMFNTKTEEVLPFSADIPGPSVDALLVKNDTLFAGGTFGSINGQDWTAPVAAFSLKTGELLPWKPNLTGNVLALETNGNNIFLGGNMQNQNGAQYKLTSVDNKTANVLKVLTNTNNDVTCLHIANNLLYVGGYFTKIAGKNRNYLAAFDANTLSLKNWNPSPNSWVKSISSIDSLIWVGGNFGSIGDSSTGFVAAINANTGLVTYNPFNNFLGSQDADAFFTKDKYIIAASVSFSRDNFACNNIIVYDIKRKAIDTIPNCQLDENSSIAEINTMAFAGNDLYIGGEFAVTNGKANATNIERIRFPDGFFQTTLPVTLLSFTAQPVKENVLLQWQTVNEVNTNYFVVERSIDGAHFITVSTVTAIGGANTIAYKFSDENAMQLKVSRIYYRLRMVDNDGRLTYSPLRTLITNSQSSTLDIYPNPAYSTILVTVSDLRGGQSMPYSLTDISGKTIKQGYVTGSRQEINITTIARGVYFLKLANGKTAKVLKL